MSAALRLPPRFDESFAHDLSRPAGHTLQCFICKQSVPVSEAFGFEHKWGPRLACHQDCLEHTPGERVVIRYHLAVGKIIDDGARA